MKVDQERADAWYAAIIEFLEEQAEQRDAEVPWSLIFALCRVLADVVEGVDGTNEKKLEAVLRLTAMALGMEDKFLILLDSTGPVN